ncbi:MAG TPA: GTPase ObgE [Cyclobacteriaceae bacterium]|nr:GTPase ObgE [Cyclobacteriaceae bacterium]HMV08317.1 GTPase ObgE [Cyclobacteriaceae bacterium]HMV88406.1 GTPase ObgE [Cyclobacteriaceae bacterium]HMX02160.1 GTPase ObgE [Cyclobacteriaceae bacterium]HMX49864.1 GTPase ObgE [Cyclobacteriaceae bacterium]
MSSPNFIDHVKFQSRSGKGGAGCLHFIREKFVEKGGPDGGDGGRGGHVILKGNSQLWTLLHLKYRKHVVAENGKPGESQNCTGASGKDEVLEVPMGTVARDAETGEKLCEITEDGQEYILTRGGRGGRGNLFFATSTQRAPTHTQPGEPGIEQWIVLELKLLADVGLVGFPNAGKSTLLSVVSAAKPKIADYAFTTLTPNLGVVSYREDKSFVMADIPGIIEGAAEGKGLGIRFLRHIERNSLLLFMIPADSKDIKTEYGILLNELKKYNPELLDKKRMLAITKSDMLDAELKAEMRKDVPSELPVIFISAVTNQGISELKDLIWKNLH